MEQSKIFAAIKRNVLAVVPEIEPDTILMNCCLSDPGCNSIDRAEVVTMTMEELGITVPLHEFRQDLSIAKLVALMSRHS